MLHCMLSDTQVCDVMLGFKYLTPYKGWILESLENGSNLTLWEESYLEQHLRHRHSTPISNIHFFA